MSIGSMGIGLAITMGVASAGDEGGGAPEALLAEDDDPLLDEADDILLEEAA